MCAVIPCSRTYIRFGQPIFDRLFYNRYRRAAIAAATGRLLMVGLGPGTDLKFVPPAVTSVAAVEPVAAFRRMASHVQPIATASPPISWTGPGESIPFPDNSFDSVHISLVLCSVDDEAATLSEIRRVLVPGGRLVVLEHVRGEGITGRFQDLIAKPWSWLAAGCEPNRRTVDAIAAAGFDTTQLRRVRGAPVPFPVQATSARLRHPPPLAAISTSLIRRSRLQ